MKRTLNLLVIGLAGGLSFGALDASAHMEVSAGVEIRAAADFEAPLQAQGTWISVGTYGRCWRPAGVAVGWRPYCEGEWVWTDCGWYWRSDEPWAWACYHYGGWVYDSFYGWVWVPGVEWAPAWVSWRVGGGYIGWAPLGPGGVFIGAGGAVSESFVFLEADHFHERVRRSTVIVNNPTIIHQTRQITNVRRETRTLGPSGSQKVIVNEGPGIAVIQKATGRQIKPEPIQQLANRTPIPRALPQATSTARDKQERPTRVDAPPKVVGQPPKPAFEPAVPVPREPPQPTNRPGEFRQPVPPPRPMPTPPPPAHLGSDKAAPLPQPPSKPPHQKPTPVPHDKGRESGKGGE
jgi:hypothetical protein